METCRQRYSVAPSMKRDGYIVLGSQSRNLSDLRDTAGPGDIGLQKIHRAPRDEIFESIVGIEVLADGNGNFTFLSELRMAFDVFGKQRLLEPKNTALGECLGCLQTDIDVIALIRVGHDRKIFAQLLAHGANYTNVLIQLETNLAFNY